MPNLSREEIFELLNPDYETTIGYRLKRVRMVNALTQQEMAKELGMSKRGYIHYELAERSIPANQLVQICLKYEVDANWLLLGIGRLHRYHDPLADVDLSVGSAPPPIDSPPEEERRANEAVQHPNEEEIAEWDMETLKQSARRLTPKERAEIKRTGKIPGWMFIGFRPGEIKGSSR